jgi:hypothetical protein
MGRKASRRSSVQSANLATSLDAALAELATDPIGVLRASGVRGKRRDPCGCPVAEFVKRRLGVDYASVGIGDMVTRTEKRKLPVQVGQAIREIDAGKHPELCV